MARPKYPEEFREQLIDLVRAGLTPEALAKEFEPSAPSIRNWVAQADRDGGRRGDGLTTDERTELSRLRRENRELKLERDAEILQHLRAFHARSDGTYRAPRLIDDPREVAIPVGQKRVASVMRLGGLVGVSRSQSRGSRFPSHARVPDP